MKKIVSILVVLVSLAVGFSAFAEGQKDSGEKQIHIGVAAALFDDKWMSYMHDGMREAAEELGVKLTMVDGKNDPAIQQGQIDTLITQGVDAIAIVPVDQSAIGPLLDEAEKAGIPMVAINRAPGEPNLSRLATYVGSDSLYAGTVQMEEVVKLLGGSGDCVVMHGGYGHEAQVNRTQGNHDVADKNAGINIVREDTAAWDRAKGLELMENWIQAGFNIDAVVANNDEMAIGAIMALEQVGMLDDVIVAGVDATPDALRFMESGKLNVTVFQDAFGQGRGGIEAAVRAAKGEDLPKFIDIPYELVTPDKLDVYKAKWGM